VNYLAHAYLADLTRTSLAGSFFGDFVRGPLDGRLPADIEQAVRLHRRIDSFTDSHPRVLALKQRTAPPYRRYAGILLDVFFDHFLARHWSDCHHQTLDAFARNFYSDLDDRLHLLGDGLRDHLVYMRKYNLLGSYREIGGIEHALAGLSTRLSRQNPLAQGGCLLRSRYLELETAFHGLLPDLVRFARSASTPT
jgi:acyl carrier protein phosphodiesterase